METDNGRSQAEASAKLRCRKVDRRVARRRPELCDRQKLPQNVAIRPSTALQPLVGSPHA